MFGPMAETGARDGIWTHDNLLGKQIFYRWITLAIKEQIKTFRNQQCSLFVNLFYNAQKNEQTLSTQQKTPTSAGVPSRSADSIVQQTTK